MQDFAVFGLPVPLRPYNSAHFGSATAYVIFSILLKSHSPPCIRCWRFSLHLTYNSPALTKQSRFAVRNRCHYTKYLESLVLSYKQFCLDFRDNASGGHCQGFFFVCCDFIEKFGGFGPCQWDSSMISMGKSLVTSLCAKLLNYSNRGR